MSELTRRYVVTPLATPAPFDLDDPDGVFVLKPWKDPAALRALLAYRNHCYPELRRDLDAWIRAIEVGPTVRGDVGRRNEPHAGVGGGRAVAPAARAKRKSAARRANASRARSRHAPKRGTGHRKKRRGR